MAKTETVETDSPVAPAYFDSALIAKFYLNEPGRKETRGLAKSAGIVVTSGIAMAEVSAAFHRKFREGAVDSDVFEALNGQFYYDLKHGLWRLIGPTQALLEEVRLLYLKLDGTVFLRSLDALHLVTARSEGFTRIYSNDRHLLSASSRLGLEGVNPIAQQPVELLPNAVDSDAQPPKRSRRPRKSAGKTP